MSILLNEDNLTIKLGSNTIINDSKLIINSNSRIGIVGSNGCGKSTLINYIYNHLSLININKHIVNQHIVYDSKEQTVLDFMLRTNINIYNINELVSNPDIDIDEYQKLIQSPDYSAYDKYKSDCIRILAGLGIIDLNSKISSYSGGWLMKLSIAKSLIISPDILIMDEPTNHLDLDAIIWLGTYLSTYTKCLLIVSHQIDFIDNFSNQIWYIGTPDYKLPKLYVINGNYNRLQKTLTDINKQAENAYAKVNSKVKEMQTKSKSKIEIQKYIESTGIPRPPKKYEIKINFPDIDKINSSKIIKFENVDFEYNSEKPILINSDFSIDLDDRIAIIGSNGCGKSTLLKLCLGEIKPTRGTIIRDHRVKISYYNQQVIENLPLDITPIEYIQRLDNQLSIEQCRKILSKVGLINTDCTLLIDKLSGGQKARVSFCKLQVKEPNIILLDEPTNHLDIETIQGLIDGINEYKGGIIMITHDIYLINSINNIRVVKLNNGKLNELKNGFF